LGSKQALSNGNEPMELTDLVAAFEGMNKCKITLSCSLELHKGFLDLQWTAVAASGESKDPVPYALVLASVKEWGGDYKTVMGLVTHLLYALDFRLAEREFASVPKKRA
jgi:hypothetical protein